MDFGPIASNDHNPLNNMIFLALRTKITLPVRGAPRKCAPSRP
jgi:hypothetical protein